MYARLRFLVLILVASVTPAVSGAQTTSARTAPAAGPRIDATATAFRGLARARDSVAAATTQRRSSQNVAKPVALMIVGGAAIVLGAVIGDDIGTLFMIGGAVALLIGLYRYLQ